jgi:hypothetical protein
MGIKFIGICNPNRTRYCCRLEIVQCNVDVERPVPQIGWSVIYELAREFAPTISIYRSWSLWHKWRILYPKYGTSVARWHGTSVDLWGCQQRRLGRRCWNQCRYQAGHGPQLQMATALQINLWLEMTRSSIFGFEAGFVLGMGCVDVLELE